MMQKGDTIVRAMNSADLTEVSRISNECFSAEGWSEKLFSDALLLEDKYIMMCAVSAESGEILGFITLSRVLDEVTLEDIAVSPSHRKKGVARELISSAIAELSGVASFITLEVREKNSSAISLYNSVGFETVGLRKNYYSEPLDNALLMTLSL